MMFYDSSWVPRGTKQNLEELLSEIINIPAEVLENADNVNDACIARRMSWASHRETKRVEDRAYCLLGIFGIHMPMIYGEGTQAFIRLQEEIIKGSSDRSIFASQSPSITETYRGLLAYGPEEFAHFGSYYRVNILQQPYDYQLTNRGISFVAPMPPTSEKAGNCYALDLGCRDFGNNQSEMWLFLRRTKGGFVREAALQRDFEMIRLGTYASYFQHQRSVVAKTLSESDMRQIENQYFQSVQVILPKSAAILKVWPEEYWDRSMRTFIQYDVGVTLGFVLYEFPYDKRSERPCFLLKTLFDEVSSEDESGWPGGVVGPVNDIDGSRLGFHIHMDHDRTKMLAPIVDMSLYGLMAQPLLDDIVPTPTMDGRGDRVEWDGLYMQATAKEDHIEGQRGFQINVEMESAQKPE